MLLCVLQRLHHIDGQIPGTLNDQLLLLTLLPHFHLRYLRHHPRYLPSWIMRALPHLPNDLAHNLVVHRILFVELHRATALRLQERMLQQPVRSVNRRPNRRLALETGAQHVQQPGVSVSHCNGKRLRKRGKRDFVGGMGDGDQLLGERKRSPGRLLVDHLVENAAEGPHVAGATNLRSRWRSDPTRMLLRPFVSLTSSKASGEM